MSNRKPLVKAAREHQHAALMLHILIVSIFGVLALVSIAGGIVAICLNAQSKTDFDILGAHLTTGSVGVAFVALGLIIAFFTVRAVLRNQRDLAQVPPDEQKKASQTTITQSNITTGGDNAGRDINKH